VEPSLGIKIVDFHCLLVQKVVPVETQYYGLSLLDIATKYTKLIVCTLKKEILALFEVFSDPPCHLLLTDMIKQPFYV